MCILYMQACWCTPLYVYIYIYIHIRVYLERYNACMRMGECSPGNTQRYTLGQSNMTLNISPFIDDFPINIYFSNCHAWLPERVQITKYTLYMWSIVKSVFDYIFSCFRYVFFKKYMSIRTYNINNTKLGLQTKLVGVTMWSAGQGLYGKRLEASKAAGCGGPAFAGEEHLKIW